MSSILHSPTTAPGRFGPYGGRYVPETLMVPLFELERAYEAAKSDASFQSRFHDLLKNFAGRPTPLQFASRLTEKLGGPRIYLKREVFCTPGRTKSTTPLGKACPEEKWASRASSRKPARDSQGSRPPPA